MNMANVFTLGVVVPLWKILHVTPHAGVCDSSPWQYKKPCVAWQ